MNCKGTIHIEMIQGITESNECITYVSKEYPFVKYRFLQLETVHKPTAKFIVKYKLPKKRFFESDLSWMKRIENLLYKHLEIFNVNYT